MKSRIALYTPINPRRPHVGLLKQIHLANLAQQGCDMYYEDEEVCLHHNLQKEGLWRGQNVVHHFNQFYLRVKDDYEFIAKWDDDIILPRHTLEKCLRYFEDPQIVGCGLFQADYGMPTISMTDPLAIGDEGHPRGWYGAFSRFYIYRMSAWGEIPVECPWLYGPMPETVRGEHSGDPDNAFQITITGRKHILNVPAIHLDHRALRGNDDAYRVFLDFGRFLVSML